MERATERTQDNGDEPIRTPRVYLLTERQAYIYLSIKHTYFLQLFLDRVRYFVLRMQNVVQYVGKKSVVNYSHPVNGGTEVIHFTFF